MRATEIQVLGVEMRRCLFPRFGRNLGPVKLYSGKVSGLDTLPNPQAMNPLFEPVMIRGDNHKQSDKSSDRQVAAVVPADFEQGDARDESGNKNNQPPAGKSGAGGGAACEQALDPSDAALELRRAHDVGDLT